MSDRLASQTASAVPEALSGARAASRGVRGCGLQVIKEIEGELQLAGWMLTGEQLARLLNKPSTAGPYNAKSPMDSDVTPTS